MAKDVYEPEVEQETPFPGEEATYSSVSQDSSGGNYSQATSEENPIPTKRIAVELLSQALNTRSKKILQEFELQQSGGFQIGNYKEGENGDIRITPNGITARDVAGVTTFAIDGTTGNAVFKGTVQAGTTIVAGTIVTEESSNGNGRTVYYNDGVAAIVIGDPS